MFIFKKNKIVVDCFTDDAYAYEHAPIAPARKYLPQWWKDLAPTYDNHTSITSNNSTIKKCIGVTQYFAESFIIPFWGGMELHLTDHNTRTAEWQTSYKIFVEDYNGGEASPLENLPGEMYNGFVDKNFIHFKLNTPWAFCCNTDTRFMMSDPIWNRHNLTDYTVLPGILDFKYQTSTNVNMMFEFKDRPLSIILNPRTPLASLTPLTDKEVVFKNHLVTIKEMIKYRPGRRFIMEDGETKYHMLKRLFHDKEDNIKKCPFGFGKK